MKRLVAAWLVVAVAGLLLPALGARRIAAQDVIISEVMASNRSNLRDEDNDSSDWFELYYGGAVPLRLDGWFVTDDPDDFTKWPLAGRELAPGSFLVVFASGKDRRDPDGEPHTNFELQREGEFLALVSPAGLPHSFFAPSFPEQRPDISYGVTMETAATELVSAGATARSIVLLRRSDLPDNWTDPELDDSSWEEGPLGFGYDETDPPAFEGLFETDTGERMFEKNASIFVRVPLEVPSPEEVGAVQLRVLYDGGFIAYLNGVEVARRNIEREGPGARVSQDRSVDEAVTPEIVPLELPPGLLRAGRNVLAFQGQNDGPTSPEFLFVPSLQSLSVASVGSGRKYFVRPSPGLPNESSGADTAPERIAPEIFPPPGEYTGGIEVTMGGSFPIEGAEIRYSLTGAPPTERSPLYEGPIPITESTVVRAAVFPASELTDVVTQSYLIQAERYDLPIISVAMRPSDFRTVQLESQARGFDSEREAHIEFFDTSGERAAANGMGLRLHGARGRGGDFETKKSYRTYFRGIYGEPDLLFAAIPDTSVDVFDKLVLRGNVNDRFASGGNGTLLRDELGRELHGDMGELIAHGTWYNLFVNMEHRGVYNVVERIDGRFLESHLDDDDWIVVRTEFQVGAGDPETAREMLRDTTAFFREKDLSNDVLYRQARTLVDMDALARHILHNVWIGNGDWPHNNWYMARPAAAGGRWFFLSWDVEFGFRNPRSDEFDRLTQAPASPIGDLFSGAMDNARFQQFFLEEFERQLRSALSVENALARLARLREIVAVDIEEEAEAVGADASTWPALVDDMEEFIRQRTPFIRTFIYSSDAFDIPRVMRVEPPVVRPQTEVEVTLHGFGFTPETTVEFNGRDAFRVRMIDAETLRAVLPVGAGSTGAVEVRVTDPVGGMGTPYLLTLDPDAPEVLPDGRLPGDCNQDGRINVADPICLIGFLFGGAPSVLPCGDGSVADPGNVSLMDSNGSGGIDLTDAVRLLRWSFFGEPPHVLGVDCLPIAGCDGLCFP